MHHFTWEFSAASWDVIYSILNLEESIELNNVELSIYDFIMGSEVYLEMQLEGDDKLESSDKPIV